MCRSGGAAVTGWNAGVAIRISAAPAGRQTSAQRSETVSPSRLMSTGWIMKPNLLLHVATVRPDPAASPGVELTLSMAMSVSASKTFMTIIAHRHEHPCDVWCAGQQEEAGRREDLGPQGNGARTMSAYEVSCGQPQGQPTEWPEFHGEPPCRPGRAKIGLDLRMARYQ